jgi:hypothetical protein
VTPDRWALLATLVFLIAAVAFAGAFISEILGLFFG